MNKLFYPVYFIWGIVVWVVSLLLTLIIADLIGNTFLILIGGGKKVQFHSRFFFIERSKWDKNYTPKPKKQKKRKRKKAKK